MFSDGSDTALSPVSHKALSSSEEGTAASFNLDRDLYVPDQPQSTIGSPSDLHNNGSSQRVPEVIANVDHQMSSGVFSGGTGEGNEGCEDLQNAGQQSRLSTPQSSVYDDSLDVKGIGGGSSDDSLVNEVDERMFQKNSVNDSSKLIENLKIENFNLKLRIYYYEQDSSLTDKDLRTQNVNLYIERDDLKRKVEDKTNLLRDALRAIESRGWGALGSSQNNDSPRKRYEESLSELKRELADKDKELKRLKFSPREQLLVDKAAQSSPVRPALQNDHETAEERAAALTKLLEDTRRQAARDLKSKEMVIAAFEERLARIEAEHSAGGSDTNNDRGQSPGGVSHELAELRGLAEERERLVERLKLKEREWEAGLDHTTSLQHKLNQRTRQLEECDAQVAELQTELGRLETRAAEATKALEAQQSTNRELSNKVAVLERAMQQGVNHSEEVAELQTRIDSLNDSSTRRASQFEDMSRQLADLGQKLSRTEDDLRDATYEKSRALQQLDSLRASALDADKRSGDQRNSINTLLKENSKLRMDKEDLTERISDLENNMSRSSRQGEHVEGKLRDAKERIDQLESSLQAEADRRRDMEEELQSAKDELLQRCELSGMVEKLRVELADLKTRCEEKDVDLRQSESSCHEKERLNRELSDQIGGLNDKLQSSQDAISQLQSSLRNKDEELTNLKTQLTCAEDHADNLQRRVESAEQNVSNSRISEAKIARDLADKENLVNKTLTEMACAKADLESSNVELSRAKRAVQDAEDRAEALQRRLDEVSSLNSDKRRELEMQISRLEDEKLNLQLASDADKRELKSLSSQLSAKNDRIAELERSNERVRSEMKEKCEKLESFIRKLEADLSGKSEQNSDLRNENQLLLDKLSGSESQCEALRARNRDIIEKNDVEMCEKQQELKKREDKIYSLEHQLGQTQKSLEEAEAENLKLASLTLKRTGKQDTTCAPPIVEEYERSSEELRRLLRLSSEQLRSANDRVTELQQECDQLRARIGSSQHVIGELEATVHCQKLEISSLKADKGKGQEGSGLEQVRKRLHDLSAMVGEASFSPAGGTDDELEEMQQQLDLIAQTLTQSQNACAEKDRQLREVKQRLDLLNRQSSTAPPPFVTSTPHAAQPDSSGETRVAQLETALQTKCRELEALQEQFAEYKISATQKRADLVESLARFKQQLRRSQPTSPDRDDDPIKASAAAAADVDAPARVTSLRDQTCQTVSNSSSPSKLDYKKLVEELQGMLDQTRLELKTKETLIQGLEEGVAEMESTFSETVTQLHTLLRNKDKAAQGLCDEIRALQDKVRRLERGGAGSGDAAQAVDSPDVQLANTNQQSDMSKGVEDKLRTLEEQHRQQVSQLECRAREAEDTAANLTHLMQARQSEISQLQSQCSGYVERVRALEQQMSATSLTIDTVLHSPPDSQHVTSSEDQPHVTSSEDGRHVTSSDRDQPHMTSSEDWRHVTSSEDRRHVTSSDRDQPHLTSSEDGRHVTSSEDVIAQLSSYKEQLRESETQYAALAAKFSAMKAVLGLQAEKIKVQRQLLNMRGRTTAAGESKSPPPHPPHADRTGGGGPERDDSRSGARDDPVEPVRRSKSSHNLVGASPGKQSASNGPATSMQQPPRVEIPVEGQGDVIQSNATLGDMVLELRRLHALLHTHDLSSHDMLTRIHAATTHVIHLESSPAEKAAVHSQQQHTPPVKDSQLSPSSLTSATLEEKRGHTLEALTRAVKSVHPNSTQHAPGAGAAHTMAAAGELSRVVKLVQTQFQRDAALVDKLEQQLKSQLEDNRRLNQCLNNVMRSSRTLENNLDEALAVVNEASRESRLSNLASLQSKLSFTVETLTRNKNLVASLSSASDVEEASRRLVGKLSSSEHSLEQAAATRQNSCDSSSSRPGTGQEGKMSVLLADNKRLADLVSRKQSEIEQLSQRLAHDGSGGGGGHRELSSSPSIIHTDKVVELSDKLTRLLSENQVLRESLTRISTANGPTLSNHSTLNKSNTDSIPDDGSVLIGTSNSNFQKLRNSISDVRILTKTSSVRLADRLDTCSLLASQMSSVDMPLLKSLAHDVRTVTTLLDTCVESLFKFKRIYFWSPSALSSHLPYSNPIPTN